MLRGRCACDAVGYEVADEFVVAYNCHCSNCRAMTGSAFLPWGEIEPEKLRITNGTESVLVDAQADRAHVRRLEGSVASDPRRLAPARRVPVVFMTSAEPRHI
jgi:hypothetical protein